MTSKILPWHVLGFTCSEKVGMLWSFFRFFCLFIFSRLRKVCMSSFLYRVFLAKKYFPKKAAILSNDVIFLGRKFSPQFLSFVIYFFLYLLYTLTCIFIVLCCFPLLKLTLMRSSYFDDVVNLHKCTI